VLDLDIAGADRVANFLAIKGHKREKIGAESAKKVTFPILQNIITPIY